MSHLSKSTTLFPRRMITPSLIDNNSEADFFYKAHITSECQNRILQESGKTSLHTSRKPTVVMPNKASPPASANSVSSPKRKSKGIEMKSLKCFLCNRVIKTDHLSEHLLFGEVKCAKCPAVFKDCQCFQLWTIEIKLGNTSCEHVLQYSKDPLQSLELHLANQYLENGTACRTSVIDRPAHLKAYISGMKSLKHELPWQEAVSRFKSYNNNNGVKGQDEKIYTESEKQENTNQSNQNINNVFRAVDCNLNNASIVCSQDRKNDISLQSTKNGDGDKFTTKDQGSGELATCHDMLSHGVNSVLKKSSNNISNGDSNVSNKKRKSDVKKRKKTEWISGLSNKKKGCTTKSKRSVGYVETPLNGFYYVVRHAVTECPNCYAQISPPDFTVNIVTFLMTAVCIDCGLTIYIVHDPPDDSAPRVCIVSGDEKHLSPRKKNNQKTLKDTAIV